MPALGTAAQKALTLVVNNFPAFSGPRGEISHLLSAQTISGQNVVEGNALRVAAIWIATTILADEIASISLKIIRRNDRNRERLEPPSLRALWGQPNPDQTRFGLEATETLSLMLWGAAYTFLGWTRAKELDQRWSIDPSKVTLRRLDDLGLRLDVMGQGSLENRPGQLPEFEFTPLYTLPGDLVPVSPVQMAAELAGLSLAYQETSGRLMARGLNPSAVLTFGDVVPPDIAKQYSDELSRIHGGSANAGKVSVIGGPTPKLERLGMSMADAEFIAQNEYVFKILLAMWRIPPTVAGMVDKPSTWGTGIAEFSRGLERFTLRPITERKSAAHEKYITGHIDPTIQVLYLFDSLLSASPKERVEIQRARLINGLTSVERVLAQEDEAPFEPGETVYSQLAFATSEERVLENLTRRARVASELVRSGIDIRRAFLAVRIDPDTLEPLEGPPANE